MAMRRTLLTFLTWCALVGSSMAQEAAPAAPPTEEPPAPGAFGSMVVPCEPGGAFPGQAAPSLLPNGFDEGICAPCGPRVTVGLEYLILWYKAHTLPPVLSTGSALGGIPGGLGQPGTRVLLGGEPTAGPNAAGRFSVCWYAIPDLWNVEANFLYMVEGTQSFDNVSNAAGSPVLSRPYFDLTGRFENADPRALPNVLLGTTSDELRTQIMGGELNFRRNLSGAPGNGGSFSLLAGARWLNLEERYANSDTVRDLPLQNALALSISDSFETTNNFCGGQLGAQFLYRFEAFTLSLQGKCAAGPNVQNVRISGNTVQTDFVRGVVTTDSQGFYAQDSNIGSTQRNRFAILPEFALNCTFDLSDRIRLNVGYTVFWLTNVVRPGDQIDRVLDQTVLNPRVVPAGPRVPFTESDFWAQWFNIGFEVDF